MQCICHKSAFNATTWRDLHTPDILASDSGSRKLMILFQTGSGTSQNAGDTKIYFSIDRWLEETVRV
jgi:hypothetical protein